MKGAFQTAITLALFGILLTYAALFSEDPSRVEEARYLLDVARVSAAWTDAAREVGPVVGLNLTRDEKNLTFSETLPAPYNVTQGLQAQEAFVTRTFAQKGLVADFRPGLVSLEPRLELAPLGINYSYASWAKGDVTINASPSNFSSIQNLTLRLNVTTHSFKKSYINPHCTPGFGWQQYVACTPSTTYCLHLDLLIFDQTGTPYDNPCDALDVGVLNELVVEFHDGGTDHNVTFHFGPVPGVIHFEPGGADLSARSILTLGLNTTGFTPEFSGRLSVKNPSSDVTVNQRIKP